MLSYPTPAQHSVFPLVVNHLHPYLIEADSILIWMKNIYRMYQKYLTPGWLHETDEALLDDGLGGVVAGPGLLHPAPARAQPHAHTRPVPEREKIFISI